MLQILSQKDRERIHNAGLEILDEVGVKIHNKTVFSLLLDAGAIPDKNDAITLHFPEEMVKRHLSLCPKSFQVRDRKGIGREIRRGADPLYYTSNALQYTRGTSKTTVDVGVNELAEFVRVVDKLENVHGIVGTSIKEYAPQIRDLAGFRLMAQYSYKHLRPCIYTPSGAEAIIEMADVILDGKPLRDNMFFTLGYSIVSPLTWSETALELFCRTKGYGIPIMINSEPMAGGTSPVTLAGCLALSDAEVLSGIVINQAMEAGRPCIYNSGFAHVLDMMTTVVLTGAPENALLQAAGAEMAEYHRLPCASWALSDSPMLDSQASSEKLFTMLSHTLEKVNMVWGIGNIEASRTISPEIAVIDNELAGECMRFSRGIEVDEDHLALDVIKEVGLKGSYIDTEHTFRFFREETRYSRLPNRVTRALWREKGSKSMEEKAESVVNDILNRTCDCYLTGSQMGKLDVIQSKWTERLAR